MEPRNRERHIPHGEYSKHATFTAWKQWFTAFELFSRYQHIPVAQCDTHKTASVVSSAPGFPGGHPHFNRMCLVSRMHWLYLPNDRWNLHGIYTSPDVWKVDKVQWSTEGNSPPFSTLLHRIFGYLRPAFTDICLLGCFESNLPLNSTEKIA